MDVHKRAACVAVPEIFKIVSRRTSEAAAIDSHAEGSTNWVDALLCFGKQ